MYHLLAAIGVVLLLLIEGAPSAGDQPSLAPTEEMMVPKGASSVPRKPTLQKIIEARRDILGEAAMRRPNGPSYEFFRDAIPPLRYSDAEFKCYPFVLSAPGSMRKARLVSNGSAVNAKGKKDYWYDVGFPVTFLVGDGEVFGSDLGRLSGPVYAEGFLPIVRMSYRHSDAEYEEEAFVGVEEPFSTHAAVFAKFSLASGKSGRISARLDIDKPVTAENGCLTDDQGRTLVRFSRDWKWNDPTRTLIADLSPGKTVCLCIFTEPVSTDRSYLSYGSYRSYRMECQRLWQDLLVRGISIETPEAVVNNAWRALVIQTFSLLKGDMMCYSIGNGYERLFGAECGDSARALLLWGYGQDVKKMLPSLMAYWQQGVEYHDAGFKLQLLSHYYRLTRDVNTVRALKEHWERETGRIIADRGKENGLLPRESFCGDIETKVYSLNSNANSWRGLRDMSAVLGDIGEREEAARLAQAASDFRPAILKAVEQSERRDVSPPFIPMALFGEEPPHDRITETYTGSYWSLLAPYILGSGVLGDESEKAGWIIDYLHEHGGVCMGLVRYFYEATDDLYGIRYVLALLRRDQTERALVSFYGKLAQGLSQDTFVGGEGCRLPVIDEYGRHMHLPPNSSSAAHFLWTLRYLMVQDWDMDDDGKPDTLRLMFATPKRWLEDAKTVKIEHAPTAFGNVSVSMTSHLETGEIVAQVTSPPHAPGRMLLRARVPDGWKVLSAKAGGKQVSVDPQGTVDITGMSGRFTIRFQVGR